MPQQEKQCFTFRASETTPTSTFTTQCLFLNKFGSWMLKSSFSTINLISDKVTRIDEKRTEFHAKFPTKKGKFPSDFTGEGELENGCVPSS